MRSKRNLNANGAHFAAAFKKLDELPAVCTPETQPDKQVLPKRWQKHLFEAGSRGGGKRLFNFAKRSENGNLWREN